MAFKKFLTKAGLIEEEVQVSKAPAKSSPQAGATGLSVPNPSAPAPQYYGHTPAIDPSINEMLLQSLEANKLSGFDYLKFSSSVEETKAFAVPEDARYKMAFSTAKQLGVDKNSLLKSGQHYLDVLTQDEASFSQECGEHEKNEVQAREAKLLKIESTMADLSKQLAQLQNDHVTLRSELQEEKIRLESRKVSFQVTLQNLRASIESNIQKINQYL